MPSRISSIDPEMTLRELVARDPRAEAVLTHYGMDTCCGSGIPLSVAAQRHGVPLDALLGALGAALGR